MPETGELVVDYLLGKQWKDDRDQGNAIDPPRGKVITVSYYAVYTSQLNITHFL